MKGLHKTTTLSVLCTDQIMNHLITIINRLVNIINFIFSVYMTQLKIS